MVRQGGAIMYIVLFGNDRYHADLHVKAARYKFDHLPYARKFAKSIQTLQFLRYTLIKNQEM